MKQKIYIYNENTKTLHIDSCCSMSSKIGSELFETEDDVISAKGKYYIMCKICEQEREKILQKAIKDKLNTK